MTREEMRSGQEVDLTAVLLRREERAREQRELLAKGGCCLVSFTMNIPGARKRFPLATAGFREGCRELELVFSPETVLAERQVTGITGDEAMLLLTVPPEEAKRQTVQLEERHPLGRLWDMDVLDTAGQSLSRSALGLPQRTCLVCVQPAKVCARGQRHDPALLFDRAADLLEGFFRDQAADTVTACALRALLTEVSVTPKPGLVDRDNSGSHRDMDYFTFLDSAAALSPWFRNFFCLGWERDRLPAEELFEQLRWTGQQAEAAMFAATGGVNTHKGLIFSMAVLCGALGRAHAGDCRGPLPAAELAENCRDIGSCALRDFRRAAGNTAGERCFRDLQITGIRGEAAAGFPSVRDWGLPALRKWLEWGADLNDAAAAALLALIANVEDTNMIHRGGAEEAWRRRQEAGAMLENLTLKTLRLRLKQLDRDYFRNNLSPGGCADLLAVTLMLHFLSTEGITE